MTPSLRFTLFNPILAPTGLVLVNEEPVGWDKVQISLSRDKNYHSLVEFFKGSFEWYGAALEFLYTVKSTQGVDAEAGILIELTYDSDSYDEIFTGLFDLSQWERHSEGKFPYKCVVPIIQQDFWAKFINLKNTPVDLQATVSLNGTAITPPAPIVLPMPSQVLRQTTNGVQEVSTALYGPWALSDVFQLGIDNFVVDEVETNFYIPFTKVSSIGAVFPTHRMRFKGTYTFTVRYECSVIKDIPAIAAPADAGSKIFYLRVNDDTPVAFTETRVVVVPGIPAVEEGYNIYELSYTVALEVGDEVKFYADTVSTIAFSHEWLFWGTSDYTSLSTSTTYTPFPGQLGSSLNIESNNIAADTETDAFLILDAAKAILQQITDVDNVVVSTFYTTCARLNALMRGKHIRGYKFAVKQFFMSWVDWFEGADPLHCLGVGYKIIAGNKRIVIEDRSYFYNPTVLVNFDNVAGLEDGVDFEKYVKTIEVGYAKWSVESASGIDDPQTKRFFRSRFATMGIDFKILSKWYAASLGIEQTRRNRVELGKDGKTDEEIVVIAVKEDGSDYLPEVGADFDAVTNLLNSDSRINIRHSATRIFKRWLKWISGCLIVGADNLFYFSSGEGNYEMTSTLESTDCEDDTVVNESQNFEADETPTYNPLIYKAKEVPMDWETYKTLRENRENAIGISRTDTGHKAFYILDLDFTIMDGKADMVLLLAETAPL